eukprot:6371320-Pyramimonas_sp.AAC.1
MASSFISESILNHLLHGPRGGGSDSSLGPYLAEGEAEQVAQTRARGQRRRARAVLLHHRGQVHVGDHNVQLLLVLVVALGETEETDLSPQVPQPRFG